MNTLSEIIEAYKAFKNSYNKYLVATLEERAIAVRGAGITDLIEWMPFNVLMGKLKIEVETAFTEAGEKESELFMLLEQLIKEQEG